MLTIVGAGGRSHGITSVDVVWVDRFPPWSMSENKTHTKQSAETHTTLQNRALTTK